MPVKINFDFHLSLLVATVTDWVTNVYFPIKLTAPPKNRPLQNTLCWGKTQVASPKNVYFVDKRINNLIPSNALITIDNILNLTFGKSGCNKLTFDYLLLQFYPYSFTSHRRGMLCQQIRWKFIASNLVCYCRSIRQVINQPEFERNQSLIFRVYNPLSYFDTLLANFVTTLAPAWYILYSALFSSNDAV